MKVVEERSQWTEIALDVDCSSRQQIACFKATENLR
jgi:hypothetical protein